MDPNAAENMRASQLVIYDQYFKPEEKKVRIPRSHIHIAPIDNGLAFPFKHPDAWRSYPYGWAALHHGLLGGPFTKQTIDHFLPMLTSAVWWKDTLQELRRLFEMDADFNEDMYERQIAVLKGQAWNLVEILKNDAQYYYPDAVNIPTVSTGPPIRRLGGPRDLMRRLPVAVWTETVEGNDVEVEIDQRAGETFEMNNDDSFGSNSSDNSDNEDFKGDLGLSYARQSRHSRKTYDSRGDFYRVGSSAHDAGGSSTVGMGLFGDSVQDFEQDISAAGLPGSNAHFDRFESAGATLLQNGDVSWNKRQKQFRKRRRNNFANAWQGRRIKERLEEIAKTPYFSCW